MPLIQPILPSEPQPAAPPGLPLLRLGFRPFYLGAATFAAIAVPAWIAAWAGIWRPPMALAPMLWHAHEMLFGFAVAVIVGFLLTASRAWTGLDTPRGARLAALALLWLAARITAVIGPHGLYVVLDLLLLPLAATALASVLLRAGNKRNLPLVGLLLMLSLVNLMFHLATLGLLAIAPLATVHAGLALIVMIETVMAGRVVPSFTANVTPGMRVVPYPRLERATIVVTAMGLAGWVLLPGVWASPLLALAGLLHAHRSWRWRPAVTLGRPILWILHAAYAWIVLGLLLLAAATAGVLGDSPGVHALGVGATGGLIIGMMTRTARGHTGRPLVASPAEVAAYAMVMAAAVLRSIVAAVAPDTLPAAPVLVAAATLWSIAFGLYVWRFGPWLCRTRLDGKDG